MKNTILTLLLLVGFTTVALSQNQPQREKRTPEQRAQIMTDRMAEKLSLTDKQKADIYKINLDRAKEMENFHAKASAERKKAFEEQKKIVKETDDKINKLLTDDQKTAYANLKTAQKNHMRRFGPAKRGFSKRDSLSTVK